MYVVICVQGFGTVRFETVEDAQAAIQRFDGKELEGRPLQVKLDSFAWAFTLKHSQ